MSTMYVTQYKEALPQAGAIVPVPRGPALKNTALVFTSSSAITLLSACRVIRVVCTATAFYTLAPAGSTATATASTEYLPANVVEYIGVQEGCCSFAAYDGSS